MAEIVGFEREGKVRHRVAQHESFLKLPLPVRGIELLELLGSEITRAIVQLR